MWKQCIFLIIISLTLLLLQYISLLPLRNRQIHSELSYFTIDGVSNNPDDSINLGFSAFAFEEAKLQEANLQNEYDLTAVLIHWKRLESVQNTLQYLLHTHLFKQIIIWNNNPDIHLTFHHLIKHNHSKAFIHIINSKDNLQDEAKYRACFYVDSHWNISHYLRSLIASFRSDPHLLHSITDAYTFYTNLVSSYFDTTINLHSGFSWLGCVSVFLRQYAQNHLQLIDKFLKNHTNLVPLSDVFFSIWLNNIPVQINTKIYHRPSISSKRSVSFSSISVFNYLHHTSSFVAMRILEHSLRFNRSENDDVTFARQQHRRFPSYVKSSSLNDDFIFYTNILPYQLQDYQQRTLTNLSEESNAKYFSLHSTWKTVDDDLSSCWYGSRKIHSDDFFAIDFLYIQTNVTFTLAVAHSSQLQKSLELSISFDGLHWLPYRSRNGIYRKREQTLKQYLHTYLFDSSEFNAGFRSFRYISFKAVEDSGYHFEVCDVQMISKADNPIIMLDFGQSR